MHLNSNIFAMIEFQSWKKKRKKSRNEKRIELQENCMCSNDELSVFVELYVTQLYELK